MIMIIMVMNYCVEQGLPPHGDVEGDVQVGLVAAGVELHIPRSMFLFSLALVYISNKTVKNRTIHPKINTGFFHGFLLSLVKR